jgi:hypothetical protein
MKTLFSILFAFGLAACSFAAATQGTIVTSPVTVGDPVNLNNFGSGNTKEIVGGPKQVTTTNDMNALPAALLTVGTTCYVTGETNEYRYLGGGVWSLVATGTGTNTFTLTAAGVSAVGGVTNGQPVFNVGALHLPYTNAPGLATDNNGNVIVGTGGGGNATNAVTNVVSAIPGMVSQVGGTATIGVWLTNIFGKSIISAQECGAVGDGTHNDAPAMKLAISRAASIFGGGTIVCANGTYLCNDAFTQIGATGGYAELPMPDVDFATLAPISIRICGVNPAPEIAGNITSTNGAIFICTNTPPNAPSCFIGFPRPNGSLFGHSGVDLYLQDVLFRTSQDPKFNGIDGSYLSSMMLNGVNVDTTTNYLNLHQPTNGAYGVIMPLVNNGARSMMKSVSVMGFGTGISFSEFCGADVVRTFCCHIGYAVPGSFYGMEVGSLSSQWNNIDMMATGTNTSTAPYQPIEIHMFNIEHGNGTLAWTTNQNEFVDPNGYLFAKINYLSCTAGTYSYARNNVGCANAEFRNMALKMTDPYGGHVYNLESFFNSTNSPSAGTAPIFDGSRFYFGAVGGVGSGGLTSFNGRTVSNAVLTAADVATNLPSNVVTQYSSSITISNSALPMLSFVAHDSFFGTNSGELYLSANGLTLGATNGWTEISGALVVDGPQTNVFPIYANLVGGATVATNVVAGGNVVSSNATFSGNVGIGTTAPAQKLDVNGVITLQDGGSRTWPAGIVTENNAKAIDFGVNDGTSNRFGPYQISQQGGFMRVTTDNGTGSLFQFLGRSGGIASDAAILMSLTINGYLGIGTTSPGNNLPTGFTTHDGAYNDLIKVQSKTVNAASGMLLRNNNDTLGFDLWNDAYNGASYIDDRWNDSRSTLNFRMKTAGTAVNAMTILSSGNVGIGTTVPGNKLSVNGDIGAMTIVLTNAPILLATNATPSGVTWGVTVPDVWFVVTNNVTRYMVPGWINH